jgi:peptide subunit release factor 1 (eRF1)
MASIHLRRLIRSGTPLSMPSESSLAFQDEQGNWVFIYAPTLSDLAATFEDAADACDAEIANEVNSAPTIDDLMQVAEKMGSRVFVIPEGKGIRAVVK